jgi:hypothetical protein
VFGNAEDVLLKDVETYAHKYKVVAVETFTNMEPPPYREYSGLPGAYIFVIMIEFILVPGIKVG